MRVPVAARLAALAASSVLVLAGCGGSSGGGTTATETTSAAPTASSTSDSAQAAVDARQAFEKFFSKDTSVDDRVKLLQNGEQFRATIEAQQTNALAQSASVKVNDISVSGDTATVKYDILLNGQPALAGQTGTVVKVDGQWKVAVATFCSLLQQQGGAPASCPAPTVSASASASG